MRIPMTRETWTCWKITAGVIGGIAATISACTAWPWVGMGLLILLAICLVVGGVFALVHSFRNDIED